MSILTQGYGPSPAGDSYAIEASFASVGPAVTIETTDRVVEIEATVAQVEVVSAEVTTTEILVDVEKC